MVEKLVTYLEMTAADQLRPTATTDDLQVLRLRDATAKTDRIRRLHDDIATPHHWSSLTRDWSSEATQEVLSTPGRSDWIAVADQGDAGWAALVEAEGDVEIAVFGLRPGAIGRGHGGAFLTAIVRRAWERTGPGGRIWLHTSSWDHPHALRNYLARGFTVERLELAEQASPTERTARRVEAAPRFLARPAVPTDAPAVVDLLVALGYPLPLGTVQERITRLSRSREDLVAVVTEDGVDVVGVVSAHVVPRFGGPSQGFVRITALSVAPDRSRAGIGRRLTGFVEYFARVRGCDLVEVTSGRRPERAAAHRFYPALGFEDTSDRSVRYGKHLDRT